MKHQGTKAELIHLRLKFYNYTKITIQLCWHRTLRHPHTKEIKKEKAFTILLAKSTLDLQEHNVEKEKRGDWEKKKEKVGAIMSAKDKTVM